MQLDKRLKALESWITTDKSIELEKIEPASADASFRRYFRAHIKPTTKFSNAYTVIAMDAPPKHEDNALFVKCAQVLSSCGLHAPNIYKTNLKQGFLLLEDLGKQTYQDQLQQSNADECYSDASQALMKLQCHTAKYATKFKPYDRSLLLAEMTLFEQWYINSHLKKTLNNKQKQSLETIFNQLVSNALEQPQVLVHRDYHCRNLLITKTNNPGIIDFQDMVVGPISYDLVSLYKDCYISWPRKKIEYWMENYRLMSIKKGLISSNISPVKWLRWFDLMGVQRHLKVLGIFSRLNHRDNKPQYLNNLPLVNQYLKETCSHYEKLHPLSLLLNTLHNEKNG